MSRNLDPLLRPRSVAVVGASLRDPTNVGARAAHQLRRFSEVRVYVVNSGADHDPDVLTVRDLASIPEVVDLVVVAVPAPGVVDVIEDAAHLGVRAALIFTSGFAESGDAGTTAQARLEQIARETGMIINGPNTIGYLNLHDHLLSTFFLPPDCEFPEPGPVAIVSQSGALASYIDELARHIGVQPGWLVTTGNEVDVSVTDVLEYLVERPEVQVLAAFSEGLRDPDAFIRVSARAAELAKPFLLLKGGRSESGLAAAMSHTASVSGADEVLDAVCMQYGVLRADSMEQALDWLSLFQTGRRLRGDRIALLTGSGGAGVLMADASDQMGFVVEPTPQKDRDIIESLIPIFGSAVNPVDVTAQAIASGVDNYQTILETLIASDGFDAVAVGSGLRGSQAVEVATKIAAAYARTDKPVALTWYSTNVESRQILTRAGVPTYTDLTRAIGALGALRRFQMRSTSVSAEPSPSVDPERARQARRRLGSIGQARCLTEAESKALLQLYDLPTVRELTAPDASAAVDAAVQLSHYPVAVKVLSADIPHKSEVGGIRLGIVGPDGVRTAAEEILANVSERRPDARVEGLLVQEMAPAGIELVCGFHRDPVFGPVVTIGLGGVLVEIIAEVVHRRAPMTPAHARSAILELAGGRLASHTRGLGPADVDGLVDILLVVGQIATELPEIVEVDLNPIIMSASGPVIADALVVVAPGS